MLRRCIKPPAAIRNVRCVGTTALGYASLQERPALCSVPVTVVAGVGALDLRQHLDDVRDADGSMNRDHRAMLRHGDERRVAVHYPHTPLELVNTHHSFTSVFSACR